MAVYLFDLDNTLVDSSAVASLRRNKMWSQVMKNLDSIRPFKLASAKLPHEIPALVKAQGHSVGIVTSSPKKYAETILNAFDIQYDVLVAYNDTTNHKPDPEPLNCAMALLHADSKRTIYVGDDAADIEAAYHAGIKSIGAGWGVTNYAELSGAAPDVMLFAPELILPFATIPKLRYIAERAPNISQWHDGSVVYTNSTRTQFALGRYFASHDPRHASAKLSNIIIEQKSSSDFADRFAQALSEAILNLRLARQYDYIIAVPPKPGQTRDRIGEVLTDLQSYCQKPKYLEDGLTCKRDYGSLKSMNASQRRVAVSGAFKSEYNWKGNDILLIDDVLTTGATTDECIRTLERSGAKKVTLITFAKDQRSFAKKTCPDCGARMTTRKRKADGEKFWGCSSYPDCKHTESI